MNSLKYRIKNGNGINEESIIGSFDIVGGSFLETKGVGILLSSSSINNGWLILDKFISKPVNYKNSGVVTTADFTNLTDSFEVLFSLGQNNPNIISLKIERSASNSLLARFIIKEGYTIISELPILMNLFSDVLTFGIFYEEESLTFFQYKDENSPIDTHSFDIRGLLSESKDVVYVELNCGISNEVGLSRTAIFKGITMESQWKEMCLCARLKGEKAETVTTIPYTESGSIPYTHGLEYKMEVHDSIKEIDISGCSLENDGFIQENYINVNYGEAFTTDSGGTENYPSLYVSTSDVPEQQSSFSVVSIENSHNIDRQYYETLNYCVPAQDYTIFISDDTGVFYKSITGYESIVNYDSGMFDMIEDGSSIYARFSMIDSGDSAQIFAYKEKGIYDSPFVTEEMNPVYANSSIFNTGNALIYVNGVLIESEVSTGLSDLYAGISKKSSATVDSIGEYNDSGVEFMWQNGQLSLISQNYVPGSSELSISIDDFKREDNPLVAPTVNNSNSWVFENGVRMGSEKIFYTPESSKINPSLYSLFELPNKTDFR